MNEVRLVVNAKSLGLWDATQEHWNGATTQIMSMQSGKETKRELCNETVFMLNQCAMCKLKVYHGAMRHSES